MTGRSYCKLFAYVGIVTLAASAHALAAPSSPCDANPAPQAYQSLTLAPHSLQPQKFWQRQGKDIDVTITMPQIPANPRVVACFRWALQDWKASGADVYAPFVATDFAPAQVDKASGTVKAAITVPTLIEHPKSNAVAEPGEPVGVYSRNNTYANAEVRILLYGDGDAAVLALTSLIGVIEADNYCDIPGLETTTGSGIGTLGEHKNWQPVKGVFNFSITSSKIIPADALVKVCFRWKLTRGDPGRYNDSPPPQLIDSKPRSLEIAATVPNIPRRPSWFSSLERSSTDKVARRVADFAVLGVAVPRADARILVFDTDSSPIIDVITTVGITQLWFAALMVIVTISIILALLWWVCSYRLTDVSRTKPFLCLITTRRGFASLSQFQIVLWTLVVLASIIYVIALSGDLIEITTGTLVLLGISGTATVVAKNKSESDDSKPSSLPDPVAAAEAASVAKYEADQMAKQVANATDDGAREDAQGAADEAAAKAAVAQATAELADATATAVKLRGAIAIAPDDAAKQAAIAAAQAADDDVLAKKKALAIVSAKAAKIIRVRHPSWSDLVMEEVHGRELDVTRVQMLCFTIVSAVFVLLSVSTNYVIPEIPNGYLILMGISNGVYVTSKYAAKT